MVVACRHYITKTLDEAFARQYWGALERGIRRVEAHSRKKAGLITQEAYSDWADSLARTGEVLYTNIIYWKALHEMARYAGKYASEQEAQEWQRLADSTQIAIHSHFWRADLGYFVTSSELENFSSAGNLLAIAWDLVTPIQGETILAAMTRFGMDTPVPTQAMHGDYPRRSTAIENRLAGIPEYHIQGAWLWLGAWHVIANVYLDRAQEAEALLERIMAVVRWDGGVFEVIGKDGRFLSTLWFSAEAPLSCSAGMVVYAYHVLQRDYQLRGMQAEEGENLVL